MSLPRFLATIIGIATLIVLACYIEGLRSKCQHWQTAAEPIFQAYDSDVPRDPATLAHILKGKPRDWRERAMRPQSISLKWDSSRN